MRSSRVQSRGTHPAWCPSCGSEMDLLALPWCGCGGPHPSKICPSCDGCACGHPDYDNPICWEAPPESLRRFGFTRLFSPYESGAPLRRVPASRSA